MIDRFTKLFIQDLLKFERKVEFKNKIMYIFGVEN